MSEQSPPEEQNEERIAAVGSNRAEITPVLTAQLVVRENYPVATVVCTEDEPPRKNPLRRRITHVWKSFRRSLSRGSATTATTQLTASTTRSSQESNDHSRSEESSSLDDLQQARDVFTRRTSHLLSSSSGSASRTNESEFSTATSSLQDLQGPREIATRTPRLNWSRVDGATLDSPCTYAGHDNELEEDAQVSNKNAETFENTSTEERRYTTELQRHATSILQLSAPSNQARHSETSSSHQGRPGAYAIPGISTESNEANDAVVQENSHLNGHGMRWDVNCRPHQAPDLLETESYIDLVTAVHMNQTKSDDSAVTRGISENTVDNKAAKPMFLPDSMSEARFEQGMSSISPDLLSEEGMVSPPYEGMFPPPFQAQSALEDTIVMAARVPPVSTLGEQAVPTDRRQDPPGEHAADFMMFENQSTVLQQRVLASAVSDAVAAAAEAAAAASRAAAAAMSISHILIHSRDSDIGRAISSGHSPPATLALNEGNRPISDITLLAGSPFHDACAAAKIQALVRGALCRHRNASSRRRDKAATLIQDAWRGSIGHASFRKSDTSATAIQCAWRRHAAMAALTNARAAAVMIQAKLRRWSFRQKYWSLLMEARGAAVTIQSTIRRWSCGQKFRSMKRAFLSTFLAIQRFKRKGFKIILLDHLAYEVHVGNFVTLEDVLRTLRILSAANMIVYNNDDVEDAGYIILSPEFQDTILSEFIELRARLLQRNDGEGLPENELMQMFNGEASYCPLLSNEELLCWYRRMKSLRTVENSISCLPTKAIVLPQTFFGFFKRLLVRSQLLMPFSRIPCNQSLQSEVFFVSSVLPELVDTDTVWSYKSLTSWKTTLCHKWVLPSSAPTSLLEEITVRLVQDLYHFAKTFQDPPCPDRPRRVQSCPLARCLHESRAQVMQHSKGIRIHQIVCWKSALRVKILTADNNLVEIFIALVDESSPHFVGMDTHTLGAKNLVVSGKGLAGHHGKKLWDDGYKIVLESVQASLSASHVDVDAHVACPECLARRDPSRAVTWSWTGILGFVKSGNFDLCCTNGHTIDIRAISGMLDHHDPFPKDELICCGSRSVELVKKTLPKVVLVCLQNKISGQWVSVGSGFVADSQRGLIVTAAHVLHSLDKGESFGSLLCQDARVWILVNEKETGTAEVAYVADVVAKDVRNVDACVLHITNLDPHREQLSSLKMTSRCERDESVRLFGYNQGGEGIFEPGTQINQTCDFARGYICREFSCEHATKKSEGFMPRKEIVAICANIGGHSGGPVVNDEGKVIGILSRGADPANPQRCYLAPSSEIEVLVRKAQQLHDNSASFPSTLT